MVSLSDLAIKLFADGADINTIFAWYRHAYIQGFTTNPSLMRQAGVKNYEQFVRDVVSVITDKPICFEVFSDDFRSMAREARYLASFGDNVYVKIPVTNTKGESSAALISELAKEGVKQNITAIMTFAQVEKIVECLAHGKENFISIFAGRIADTGIDPMPIMINAKELIRAVSPKSQLIWASAREVFNIFQAEKINCDVITLTADLLKKLSCIGKDLSAFSLETVKMFYDDAKQSGFTLIENTHKELITS